MVIEYNTASPAVTEIKPKTNSLTKTLAGISEDYIGNTDNYESTSHTAAKMLSDSEQNARAEENELQETASFLQDSEQTLEDTERLLERASQLAEQAASGNYSDEDLAAMEEEYISITRQIGGAPESPCLYSMAPLAETYAAAPPTVTVSGITIQGDTSAYTVDGKDIKVHSGAKLVFSGSEQNYSIVVDENAQNVTLTLDNLSLDNTDWFKRGIQLQNGSSVSVILKGDNNRIYGGRETSAISVVKGSSLTIDGNGKLSAGINRGGSGAYCAVIGSQYAESYGDITIKGGNLSIAWLGDEGTAIGTARWNGVEGTDNGTITISGGSISSRGWIGGINNYNNTIIQTGNAVIKDSCIKGNYIIDGNVEHSNNIDVYGNLTITNDSTLILDNDTKLYINTGKNVTNNGTLIYNNSQSMVYNYSNYTGKDGPLVGVTVKGLTFSPNKTYKIKTDNDEKTATANSSRRLIVGLPYDVNKQTKHKVTIYYDDDRYEAEDFILGAQFNQQVNVMRATYHANVTGASLRGDTDYEIKVNGSKKTVHTDSSGNFAIKGLNTGDKLKIELTDDTGKNYKGEAEIQSADTSVTLKAVQSPPPTPPPVDPDNPTPGPSSGSGGGSGSSSADNAKKQRANKSKDKFPLVMQLGSRTKDSVGFTLNYFMYNGEKKLESVSSASALGIDKLSVRTAYSAKNAVRELKRVSSRVSAVKKELEDANKRINDFVGDKNETKSETGVVLAENVDQKIRSNTAEALLAQSSLLPQNVLGIIDSETDGSVA